MRHPRYGFAVGLLLASLAVAQDGTTSAPPPPSPQPASATPATQPTQPVQPAEDKRIFGVLPNYRTTENSIPFHSITAKQKLTIAFKDSFDYPSLITAGLFASLYQLENQNPSFGQGMAGYGRRYGTAVGDQIIGNMMTEGFMPALLKEDPRYFRLGEGKVAKRLGYAASRIFVTKMDSGRNSFNFGEWVGNSAAVAISNAYYPDTRDASDNVQKLLTACATDAFSNVLKEFWPDVKRKLFKKHHDTSDLVSMSH